MKVEHQIAIIFCGVKELLRAVPIEKVKEFETDFLERMEMDHRDVLDELREGKLTEEIEQTIQKVAAAIAGKFLVKEL
ncbi:MAG: F0F1 ATP synthase subunit alpha, partial [Tangfeifania sp.]